MMTTLLPAHTIHSKAAMMDLPEFDIFSTGDPLELHPRLAQQVLAEWRTPTAVDDDEDDVVLGRYAPPPPQLVTPSTSSTAFIGGDDTGLLLDGGGCLSPTSVLDDDLVFSAILDEKALQLLAYPVDNASTSPGSHVDLPYDPATMVQSEKENTASGNKNSPKRRRKKPPAAKTATTTVKKRDAKVNKDKGITTKSTSPSDPTYELANSWHKLHLAMQRSQESRKSLQMTTPQTERYERQAAMTKVLRSIEQSTQQLHELIASWRQHNDQWLCDETSTTTAEVSPRKRKAVAQSPTPVSRKQKATENRK